MISNDIMLVHSLETIQLCKLNKYIIIYKICF